MLSTTIKVFHTQMKRKKLLITWPGNFLLISLNSILNKNTSFRVVMLAGPVIVVIVPLVQWALVLLYNYYGHPWKQILELIQAQPISEVTDIAELFHHLP